MDAATRHLIEAIHRAPYQCVLAVTGGGAGAVAELLSVPGGSRTILEAAVPYHEQALIDCLGHRPEHFCSAPVGRDLARRAYERAGWLVSGKTVVGLGCTASLATDRPKHGDHRFYISVRSAEGTRDYSLILTKGARDREAEEAVLDAVLLNALAEAFGIAERLEVTLLPGEEVKVEAQPLDDPLLPLMRGEIETLCVESDGRMRQDAPKPAALLPGSFNPVHEGHWGLAAAAERLTGLPAAFELSVTNVDKPPLPEAEVRRRLPQFAWKAPLWLTRAPLFVEKARLFPGVVFVVGADTAERIVEPRYYQNSVNQMTTALTQIRDQGCKFLVAGRVDAAGRFLRLEDLPIPLAFRDLFTGIPEAEFHIDISSTQMRAAEPQP